MNLYEFVFIAQQSLLQQEVEEILHELCALLKNIKIDIIFQQIEDFTKERKDKIAEQELKVLVKEIQENVIIYSNFLEVVTRILWIELKKDLLNLKEVKSRIDDELKHINLGSLEEIQSFVNEFLKDSKQVSKRTFIYNMTNHLMENISKHLIKLFSKILKHDETKITVYFDNQLNRELEKILGNITASGFIKYEYWGLLDFAYPINKMKSGHYCVMCISSTPSIMNEFIRKVKLNENIIRYLSIRVREFFEGESCMMNRNIGEQSA
ncbi:MAG: 30S ribosomal protein S6 [Wolbachia endosymbiont of Menacanthus eurysternus]|nr:MAG: 30S ribosomal protein S6 [Wolbachia endosymbiont of Menacanthus eurysternus]